MVTRCYLGSRDRSSKTANNDAHTELQAWENAEWSKVGNWSRNLDLILEEYSPMLCVEITHTSALSSACWMHGELATLSKRLHLHSTWGSDSINQKLVVNGMYNKERPYRFLSQTIFWALDISVHHCTAKNGYFDPPCGWTRSRCACMTRIKASLQVEMDDVCRSVSNHNMWRAIVDNKFDTIMVVMLRHTCAICTQHLGRLYQMLV